MRTIPLLIALAAPPLAAQARTPIGTTANGNPVLLESRSVTRSGDTVTAAVRVTFAKAVRTPGGEVRSSRTILRVACTPKQVAILENWYFTDPAGTVESSHRKVGAPGFSTAIGGSMTAVAMGHLCAAK
ncbi:MAG: hypothetical protein MUF21_04090 [Gemmatimonadaceae bacterium]|nr:hypothetical protein [Gemmatimonadaceae bacterium]